MFLIRLFLTSILFFNALDNTPKNKSIFVSPLKIPILLSANFGELRIDHFHSGLDIKTQGVTGKEVVAAADGFIDRISVSPGGFGNALYIHHPSGYTTVYGHLDRFVPEIEEFVKSQQYEKKSFTITLFPGKDKFPVKQGALIAYSGNSGGSAGAHLHFEIRKTDSEVPVNPLFFDFGIIDNIKPVIEKVAFYPINNNSFVNKHHIVRKINVLGGNGKYTLAQENVISVSGMTGFGLKAYDLLNNSSNRCAVYSIELKVDSSTVYKYSMDGFSFNDSRFVNSHIDYETMLRENIYIERMYMLPNDKLPDYEETVNRGIFNFNDDKIHHILITVSDANNNKSTLSFTVKSQQIKSQLQTDSTKMNVKVMPYNRSNKFVSDNISVSIPSGALYDTLYFSFKKARGTNAMLSDLYSVHNIYTPVHKPFTIAIKPDRIPAGRENKMLLVQLGDDQKLIATSSSWSDGLLTANVLSFGNYFVGIDTVAPVIKPSGLAQGIDLSGKKELKIKITDDLSGIKSYEPTIDGNWALFEFDQKNDEIIYRYDAQRIKKGSKHTLALKVTDNSGNSSIYHLDFTW